MRDPVKNRTASSFTYEWRRFDVPPELMERNFWGYFQFVDPEFLRTRRVLEVGSGMGRHTYFLAGLAREVVGIDIGDAIHVAAAHVRDRANVRLVQADVESLPFHDATFDFACAIGVLHHLEEPALGFKNLVRVLRPGGTALVYLYWALEQAPGWKRVLLDLTTALRRITVRLPHPVVEKLAWALAAAGYVTFSIPYRHLSRWRATASLVKNFPLQRYAVDGFDVCFNDQFDRLSAPINKRFTKEQVIGLCKEAGLVELRIAEHYGWLASGRKASLTEKVR